MTDTLLTAPLSALAHQQKGLRAFAPGSLELEDIEFRRSCSLKAFPGVTFAKGTSAKGVFGMVDKRWWLKVSVEVGSQTYEFLTHKVHFFYEVPSIAEMEENEGSTSVLGANVEPDGYDEDGSPSWLIALGLI